MKRFMVGMLIIGSAIAVIALIMRKRSGSADNEWDSFAEDTWTRASTSATKVPDAVEGAASDASDATKDAASKMSQASKDAASKMSEASKDAASEISESAKNA